MDLDFDFELNPIALLMGVAGAIISLVMTFRIEGLGLIWKILTPIFTFAACYILVTIQSNY